MNEIAQPRRLRTTNVKVGAVLFTLFAMALDIGIASRPVLAQPAGKTQPNANSKEKIKKTKERVEKEMVIDSETLPKDYEPPKAELPIMALEKPTESEADLKKLKREYESKLSTVILGLKNGPEDKLVIKNSIRYYLGEMASTTNKDRYEKLPKLKAALVKMHNNVGGGSNKPTEIEQFSKMVADEFLKQVPPLLTNNFYVRLNVVMVLAEIDYPPAHQLLIQVIEAKDIYDDPENGQPEAVKIAATNGLIRLLQHKEPPIKDRTAIAHAVINQLKDPDAQYWYQLRLIDALRYNTVSIDAAGGANSTPFVVNALLDVIKDVNRPMVVRTRACMALGRVDVPPQINPNDLAIAVARCTLDLARKASAEPNRPEWKKCFWQLYLAFKAIGKDRNTGVEQDMDAMKKGPGGLLARFKGTQSVFNQLTPLFSDALKPGPMAQPNAANIKALEQYLEGNAPGPANNNGAGSNPGNGTD